MNVKKVLVGLLNKEVIPCGEFELRVRNKDCIILYTNGKHKVLSTRETLQVLLDLITVDEEIDKNGGD